MPDFVATESSNCVQTNGSWNAAVHPEQALTNSPPRGWLFSKGSPIPEHVMASVSIMPCTVGIPHILAVSLLELIHFGLTCIIVLCIEVSYSALYRSSTSSCIRRPDLTRLSAVFFTDPHTPSQGLFLCPASSHVHVTSNILKNSATMRYC